MDTKKLTSALRKSPKSKKVGSSNVSNVSNVNNSTTTTTSNVKKSPISKKVFKPKYEQRDNVEYNEFISDNNSKIITGTSINNAILSDNDETNANKSLLIHQGKDPFSVDIEAYDSQYGSIPNNSDNGDNNIITTTNCTNKSFLGNISETISTLTPVQVYILIAILILLTIMTIVLYFTGNIDQLSYIWNTIFCWLGIIECSK